VLETHSAADSARVTFQVFRVLRLCELMLQHVSADGDEGYPAALTVNASFTLSNDTLRIELRATSDAPTIVNLTNHAYWNLG
jgi:galactose mutarotase-like enzyme